MKGHKGQVDGPPTDIWVLVLVEASDGFEYCEEPFISSTRRAADPLRPTTQTRADVGLLCAHRNLSGTDGFGRRLGEGCP